MRILHVAHQYPTNRIGGVEIYTRSLARLQAAAGHDLAVFTPDYGPAPSPAGLGVENDNGVRVYRLPLGPENRPRIFLRTFGDAGIHEAIAQVVAAEQPDIVHIQHLMGLPASLASLLAERQTPYVLTLHDFWFGCSNAQLLTNDTGELCDGPDAGFGNCGRCAIARLGLPGGRAVAPVIAPMLRRRNKRLAAVFAGAARVLVATAFTGEAHARMGLPTGRLELLPLGIEATPDDLAAAAAARGRRAANSGLQLGYIGSLSYQKGAHCLIEAVNTLPAQGVTLTLHGNDTAYPDYVTDLRRMVRHPGIQFAGPIARPLLWPTLGALDVLVVPSIWYETFSLITHEAFAAGTPVVASDIGALREVVRDGVDGLLFAPGDAAALAERLRGLLDNRLRIDALRAGIRPVLLMNEHAAAIEQVYRDILAV